MSWFNQKIYTEEEVRESTVGEIPANFEVGEDVWLHVFDRDGKPSQIPAIIAGINISGWHEIKYDLFFNIGNGFYSRVDGFRGYITKPGEHIDIDGGLVDVESLEVSVSKDIKPNLVVISNDSYSPKS